MSNLITNYNNDGIKIKLDRDLHEYSSIINDKVITYISVSELISRYFKPFDVVKISKRVAENRNITPAEVIKEWDDNRNNAIDFGNKIHELAELLLLYDESDDVELVFQYPDNIREKNAFKYIEDIVEKIKGNFEILGVEKIVFDPKIKIAGTIDLFLKYNDFFIICDWKTNREIVSTNKFNTFGLGPLSDIADNNFNRYALQLNFYEYLLKLMRYVDKDTKIYKILLHVTKTGIEKIYLPDMINNIERILLDYLL